MPPPVGRSESVATLLLTVYLVCSPFTALLRLPYVQAKIQPAELVFLLLLPCAVIAYGRELLPPARWGLVLGAFVLATLCSSWAAGDRRAVLEALGRGYLVALAAIVAAYVARRGVPAIRRVAAAWTSGAVLLAAAGLVGYALALAGYENRTVRELADYPYFGAVFRAAGFTGSAAMLALVLAFPILWSWTTDTGQTRRRIALAVMLAGALLTLSKEVVLIGLGLALVRPAHARPGARGRAALVVLTALGLWAATHFVLVRGAPLERSYLADTRYVSGRVVASFGTAQIVESSYAILKRANWIIGLSHPLWGVGPGASNEHLASLRARGLYPAHLPAYDPHSTWVGAFSETGLPGVASLAVLVAALGASISRRRLLSAGEAGIRAASVLLLLLLVDSVVTDVLNLRPLWIAVGLVIGYRSSGSAIPTRINVTP
jgi:O-antigen ligase